jgi:hypothetical protein
MRRTRGFRRATAWVAGSLATLVALVALGGLPIYVFPPQEEVGTADLIYVIGPPTPARIAAERSMREEGVADLSLYSVRSGLRNGPERPDVCNEQAVACQRPDPFTTNGEALLLSEFAADHDVQRTVLLAATPHVARTRYIFEKCFDGEVTVVAVDQHFSLADWIYQYAYQTSAFSKAWTTPCATTP